MDAEAFRKAGHEMVDYIAEYLESGAHTQASVLSQVKPGYLRDLIPAEAPVEGESFEAVMKVGSC